MKRASESEITLWPLRLLAVVLMAAMAVALARGQSIEAKVGGKVAPDGTTEIHCDLPGDLHRRNTASKGLGLCVYTSIHHSAVWQDIPALQEFPKWIIDQGIPGGGYDRKVDDLIERICKARGYPKPDYIQAHLRGQEALDLLGMATRCGRLPCVTYSKSPTGRYGSSRIAHMTNLPHCDINWCCNLDNNFPGENNLEWMSPKEFLETANLGGSVWLIVFLSPGPPPPPRN